MESWIGELRTSLLEDPELVGPFPLSFTQRPLFSLAPISHLGEPDLSRGSFRSRVGDITKPEVARDPRSVALSDGKRSYSTSPASSTSSTDILIMVQGLDQQGRPGRMALPSAIQGTFIPVSPKKHRSPSPQRHKPNKSVQINLNLTENQMDRLTDV